MTEEIVLRKALKVINSCEKYQQVFVASRYARLACKQFPELYGPLRAALTRVETNFSRIKRGADLWPLVKM